jgi:hypothetical protein
MLYRHRNQNDQLAPAGLATLTVTAADVRDLPGRASQSNPTGACLSLTLSAGDGYAPIRSDLPLDHGRLLSQLADAAACDPAEMSPDFLIGRKVACVVNHFVGRSGFKKAGIGRWMPRGPVHRQHGIGRHA